MMIYEDLRNIKMIKKTQKNDGKDEMDQKLKNALFIRDMKHYSCIFGQMVQNDLDDDLRMV